MLTRYVPSALVLAQLVFAGSPGLEKPRDGAGNCVSVSTVTTTIYEQVTVTVTGQAATPAADVTSLCQPPSADDHISAPESGSPVTPHDPIVNTDTSIGSLQPTIASQSVNPTPPASSTAAGLQSVVSSTVATVSVETQIAQNPPSERGLYNMLYFGSWTIYGLGFMPETLPTDKLTHLLYAFGDIAPDGSVPTGTVDSSVSSDEWADFQIRFPGDSRETSGQNAYGNIKQLYQHKVQNRKLKTLLSIGGWTYSQEGKFLNAAQTPEARARFASSAVKLMTDWGFDGLDIDWEYPENEHETELLTLLLQACRTALDEYTATQGQTYHYLLTMAVSASPSKYGVLNMPALDDVLDTWHLMAYDYAGSWDHTTGHAANLYASPGNPEVTKANTHQAVQDYMSGGVPSDKIILGLPLYGRSFMATESRLGLPFTGYATNTSTDDGVWLYRDLPRAGASASVHVDRDSVGAWSYDPSTKELVAFDNVETTNIKADYIMDHQLGGAMFWEAAGDQMGEGSLVAAMDAKFGHVNTDTSLSDNMLDYPTSRFSNIRNKMNGGLN